eukprot:CAMPEP_0204177672 /NCGR_PEP_ID=MMETSP0361-20130328/48681_1 /ASSEMBLY_ACC=CAM_ASM_000343 /TAXON_ID=268821 /ORGANISM="Scrippsiella Hangoei, Strain SHTV-5" /LENGTH=46 /DNA_ID= /DNA_START= /DNA_END= /DNA_ORIENTATION=
MDQRQELNKLKKSVGYPQVRDRQAQWHHRRGLHQPLGWALPFIGGR